MASTGINNGTLTALYIEVDGDLEKVAHLTSNGLTVEMDTRNATTKDSEGWNEILEAAKKWSISGEGFFAEDAEYGFNDLYAVWTSREPLTAVISSEVEGDKKYEGTCYITSLSRTSPVEDSETFSISLQGTGQLEAIEIS
jgi:TP901-1 family phage major tail protein